MDCLYVIFEFTLLIKRQFTKLQYIPSLIFSPALGYDGATKLLFVKPNPVAGEISNVLRFSVLK